MFTVSFVCVNAIYLKINNNKEIIIKKSLYTEGKLIAGDLILIVEYLTYKHQYLVITLWPPPTRPNP